MELNEMKDQVTEKKETLVEKAKGIGKKVSDKAKQTGKWIKENPSEALQAGYYAVGGLFIATITALAVGSANEQAKTVYSKDIGESVKLKKKLNNQDKVELDYRMKNGETKIEALRNMNKVKD